MEIWSKLISLKVQSSKLVTSYAISPQAVFTCPPCSIRFRRLGNKPSQRFTYCSVTSPKPQIVCFSEHSNAKITTTSISLSKEAAPVSYLDTLETGSGNKLIALHKDGSITGYSNDLKTEEWRSSIDREVSNLASAPVIQAAAILSVQQARKSVLKNREDILAMLGPDRDGLDHNLLVVMSRPPAKDANKNAGELSLRIYPIRFARLDKGEFTSDMAQKLQPLVILALPEPSNFHSKKSRITMHTASGTVYQDAEGALAVYDLNGSVPRLVHTVVRNGALSYLRVSPDMVASSRGTSVSLIDLTYDSLQDQGTLTMDHEAKVAQKSESPTDKPTITEDVQLLSYFAPLGVMVALDGRKLLAIQLFMTEQVGESRKRKREGLLVNALGRGSSLLSAASRNSVASSREGKSLGAFLPSIDSSDWKAQKTALDQCVAQNDNEEFERLMAAALGINATGEINHTSSPGRQNHIHRHVVSYALKTMFSVDQAYLGADPANGAILNIDLRFFPRKIGKWLIEKGLFSLDQIELSLKQYEALPVTSKLANGSLIRALANFDSSLELLLSVLASPVPLGSLELVHVLAIVARVPNTEVTEPQRLLTNGDGEDDSDNIDRLQLVNGHTTDSIPSPFSNRSAHDWSHRLLNFAMKRLYACPPSSVALALKKELPTSQLRLLVDSLRMEIARGGWLSPYEDNLDSLDFSLGDDNQMSSIVHLFNCVIDSLGTGGWILGDPMSDDLTESADTVAYMKAEISAALEGIEEATYLKGMLGEILLYGKDSLNSSVKQSKSNEAQLPALPPKPENMNLDEEGSQLLPLGLKLAPVISTTKVGAGGELIKRSMRDIGRLKSRMVGKYSFDRIMI